MWEEPRIETPSRRRIAIFGGTFDPPHLAHRQLLLELQKKFLFDQVLVVPSKYPPGKTSRAPYEKRLAWTRAIYPEKTFEVSDLEAKTSQTLFGRDIFYQLSLRDPEAQYFWILGADQWDQLPYWKNIDDYARHMEWIVLPRTNETPTGPAVLRSRRFQRTTAVYRHAPLQPLPEIASSEIRESIAKGCAEASDVLTWIPEEIREDVILTYQNERNV